MFASGNDDYDGRRLFLFGAVSHHFLYHVVHNCSSVCIDTTDYLSIKLNTRTRIILSADNESNIII